MKRVFLLDADREHGKRKRLKSSIKNGISFLLHDELRFLKLFWIDFDTFSGKLRTPSQMWANVVAKCLSFNTTTFVVFWPTAWKSGMDVDELLLSILIIKYVPPWSRNHEYINTNRDSTSVVSNFQIYWKGQYSMELCNCFLPTGILGHEEMSNVLWWNDENHFMQ